MLSRVDDQVSETELALLTGLNAQQVETALERLAELGAIRLEAVTHRPPAGEMDAVVNEAFAELRQTLPEIPSEAEIEMSPASPLDEICDLDFDEKTRILELYQRLDTLDHYGLLSVPRSADKRAIKRAYYEIAPSFHPDRYFRKNLGSFKPKMETIFGRLTLAHDTLTRKAERANYDARLAAFEKARSPNNGRRSNPPTGGSPQSSDAFSSTARPSPPPAELTSDEERLRRVALKRRLLGRNSPSQPPSQPPPSSRPGLSAAESALQTLQERRRFAQDGAQRVVVARYLNAAREAQSRGDFSKAAQLLHLAREADPNDGEVAAAQEQMARAAAFALGQSHLEKGDEFAEQDRWREAADSYSKAANHLPRDVDAQIKTARAILKSQGDVRKAVDFARRAASLDPKLFEARQILIESYFAAGLGLLAKKELEALHEIAPNDARLAKIARRIR